MRDFEVDSLFTDNGPVDELLLDDELQQHLAERGFYPRHKVDLLELIEVHSGQPKYFRNRGRQRAPLIMLGPTNAGRLLCVPIEPAGRRGLWRPVTAFEANTHDVERYHGGEL